MRSPRYTMTSKMTNDLTLAKEDGAGKCFTTGGDKIQVFQLKGSRREIGRQYRSVNDEPIIDMK
jgi:hypothetical protein